MTDTIDKVTLVDIPIAPFQSPVPVALPLRIEWPLVGCQHLAVGLFRWFRCVAERRIQDTALQVGIVVHPVVLQKGIIVKLFGNRVIAAVGFGAFDALSTMDYTGNMERFLTRVLHCIIWIVRVRITTVGSGGTVVVPAQLKEFFPFGCFVVAVARCSSWFVELLPTGRTLSLLQSLFGQEYLGRIFGSFVFFGSGSGGELRFWGLSRTDNFGNQCVGSCGCCFGRRRRSHCHGSHRVVGERRTGRRTILVAVLELNLLQGNLLSNQVLLENGIVSTASSSIRARMIRHEKIHHCRVRSRCGWASENISLLSRRQKVGSVVVVIVVGRR